MYLLLIFATDGVSSDSGAAAAPDAPPAATSHSFTRTGSGESADPTGSVLFKPVGITKYGASHPLPTSLSAKVSHDPNSNLMTQYGLCGLVLVLWLDSCHRSSLLHLSM